MAPYLGAAPADVDEDDVSPAAMDDDDDLPPIETCEDLPRPLWPLGDTDDDEDDDGYSYLPSSSIVLSWWLIHVALSSLSSVM